MKAAVLVAGGISIDAPHLGDLVQYAPRIHARADGQRLDSIAIVPYERSQRHRLFDLLGTPADEKTHTVYDGGHFDYERNAVAREVSDWLDAHLGSTH